MSGYPQAIVPVDHVEPVPRRIRAELGGRVVLDTTHALYLWEWPRIRSSSSRRATSTPTCSSTRSTSATCAAGGSRAWAARRRRGARRARAGGTWSPAIPASSTRSASTGTALDAWYEEDEQVFVHPRNPYSRVDALRSARDRARRARRPGPRGVLLAGHGLRDRAADALLPRSHRRSTSPPASDRHRDRLPVQGPDDRLLVGADRRGAATRISPGRYDFPTRALLPIAGLVAFYDEKVDVFLDGVEQERPVTHFFS